MPLRSPAAKPASPEDLKGTVQALSDGTLAARAYCESCLARIRASEPGLKAWIALDDERALTIAAARDVERSQGAYTGALHGVPVGVKDLYDTDDLPTEMGSPAFVGNQPGKNAELVGRILAAGGYVLGKTVTTEFAYMHPAETRNPWNPRHTPGGSSSGSAAAVAARHVPVAVGTQTNGSVIRPAACCGVVGFKPSLDSLPIQGALPFAETLDQVGVFARTVADAAYFAASLAESGTFAPEIEALSRPPKIAVLPRFPLNAEIDEGLAMSHDDYRSALVRRAALAEFALDLFEDCDALASLPAPGAAPARLDITGDPSFCTLWTLLGFPALTLPTGLSDGGLPYGMQLASSAGGDDRLLRVASWCEAVIGFNRSPG